MALNILQLQSVATSEAGNALATYELGRTKGAALKFLTNLAAALPKIPLGQVSAENLGILSGELKASQSSISDSTSQLYSQVGSVIALVSQSQAVAQGGVETVDQGILVQIANNVASGILNAEAFAKGESEGLSGA